jgi:AcrR family transcriptional regulator
MSSKSVPHEAPVARAYGGVGAEERRAQRRQRFIEAGIEVFGTLGLRQSTIRDLCSTARLTDRYFYESFRRVEDVFEATYCELTDQLVTRLSGAMHAVPLKIDALAEAGLRTFFQFIRDDPRRARILLIDSLGLYFSAPSTSAIRVDAYVDVLDGLYRALYPEAAQLDLDVTFLAKSLIGMTTHSGAVWSQNGFDKSVDEVVRYNLFVWQGLDRWIREQIEAHRQPSRLAR